MTLLRRKSEENKILNGLKQPSPSESSARIEGKDSIEVCKNYEAVRQRNESILKQLEISKARLRSRVTYSPIMTQLTKLKKLYTDKLTEQENGLISTEPKSSEDMRKENDEYLNSSGTIKTPTRLKKIYGPTFI